MTWYYYVFGIAGWLLFMYQRYLTNGWRKAGLEWREKVEEMADMAMKAQDRCEEALKAAMEETLRRAIVEKETVILRRELCKETGVPRERLAEYLIRKDMEHKRATS